MIRKTDWKTKAMPEKRQDLGYQNFFWDADAEKILAGHKPDDMDDKWFIYCENGWVYFVRSWTGHYIFAFKLEGSSAGGAKVVASWVNNDANQYRSPGREANITIINQLLKSRFGVASPA